MNMQHGQPSHIQSLTNLNCISTTRLTLIPEVSSSLHDGLHSVLILKQETFTTNTLKQTTKPATSRPESRKGIYNPQTIEGSK